LVGGMTVDGFLAEAGQILHDSGRVFRRDDDVVLECRSPDDRRLEVLAVQRRMEPAAPSLLTDLFVVGVKATRKGDRHPERDAGHAGPALLNAQDFRDSLPRIRRYARRPVFDADFNLCGPGWHADRGILVHGPDVTVAVSAPSLDRAPPPLTACRLTCGGCWASSAGRTTPT